MIVTTPAPAAFRLWAYQDSCGPMYASLAAIVPTPADAEELAASFPKALRVKATTLGATDGSLRGYVTLQVKLRSDKANGGVNETGIRRACRALELLEAAGHSLEYRADSLNSYPTLEAFLASLEA
jgi:hypothetical protein